MCQKSAIGAAQFSRGITGDTMEATIGLFYCGNCICISIENRKKEYPDRPLIRISSTFFWHLSYDYDLVPISSLLDRARRLRREDEGETVYESMKVGQQVSKCVYFSP